ncbi:MAG: hypothetical protein RIK87_02605 [Fuerstiella sp.]
MGEGIDVDSLTPEAQSRALYAAFQARLHFALPDDATVYLSGQRMTTPGAERTFLVPVNDQKIIYKYEIKIEVVRGGKKYFKRQKLEALRAGAIMAIKVDAPPVPDGEPAVINVEAAPIFPGGVPADADTAVGA